MDDKKKKEDLKSNIEKELDKRKKENRLEFLSKRKGQMKKEFGELSKQRKGNLTEDEINEKDKLLRKDKEENLKQYFEKQKELKAQKDATMKDYLQFYEGPQIQKIIESNFETISEGYLKFAKQQKYTKLSHPSDFQMSFAAFKKFGHDMKIYPTILSFDDFSYIFKMITKEKNEQLKAKIKQEKVQEEENKINDKEMLNITFNEFKDALCRISCLAKFKLGGLQGITEEECINKEKELKQYLKSRWNKASKNNAKELKQKEEKKSNPNKSVIQPQSSRLSASPSPNKNKDKEKEKFEKSKKLTKEEKEKLEHDHALNAARSFSLKNFKAGAGNKSVNRTTIPAVIYEDAELNIFPEIDTENMSEETFMTLIQFIKEVLETEKKGGNINEVIIRKPEIKGSGGASPVKQQVKK